MLVIVTGPTSQSDPAALAERVQTLRSRGVDVIVIGVGSVDTSELQKITSKDPADEKQVLLTKYFDGILQYVQDIADFACGEGMIAHNVQEHKRFPPSRWKTVCLYLISISVSNQVFIWNILP